MVSSIHVYNNASLMRSLMSGANTFVVEFRLIADTVNTSCDVLLSKRLVCVGVLFSNCPRVLVILVF